MLSVSDALNSIVREVSPFPPEVLKLDRTLGRILAEDIACGTDSPPFDKALMDGFAIRAADVPVSDCGLEIIEAVMAGHVPTRTVGPGQAIRIMTGAPIPDGADAVIPVEHTEQLSSNRVTVLKTSLPTGANLIRRGTNRRVGELVLAAGRTLRAQELGALAEMGCSTITVCRQPRVAVLATGDELVPIGTIPGPGQIRNSNETMLVAQLQQAGAEAIPLGVARDDRDDLRSHIERGLAHDILLLTGGVSAGVLDLVPSELERAGVRKVFHKIRMKPGKPLWFGVRGATEGSATAPCYVFGLPGNPVSSMVCCELFVRTALRRLQGDPAPLPRRRTARLSHPYEHRDDRETWFPAALDDQRAEPSVRLMNWHGSSDLQATIEANGMAIFPAEPRKYEAGDLLDFVSW